MFALLVFSQTEDTARSSRGFYEFSTEFIKSHGCFRQCLLFWGRPANQTKKNPLQTAEDPQLYFEHQTHNRNPLETGIWSPKKRTAMFRKSSFYVFLGVAFDMSVSLPTCPSACLSVSLPLRLCLSVCLSLSVSLSLSLSMSLLRSTLT